MKLSIISEVFQKPSMDGIEVDSIDLRSQTVTTYTFYASHPESASMLVGYTVEIRTMDYSRLFDLTNIPIDFHDTIRGIGGEPIFISLESSVGSHSKTGFNNEFYVYGKLMSSMHDYVVKNKPIALKFLGYTDDMNLVYDRLIKMANKTWPEYEYVPVSDDVYLFKPVYSLVKDDGEFSRAYLSAIGFRDKSLVKFRKNKLREKQQRRLDSELEAIVNNHHGKHITDSEGRVFVIVSRRAGYIVVWPVNDSAISFSDNMAMGIRANAVLDFINAGVPVPEKDLNFL